VTVFTFAVEPGHRRVLFLRLRFPFAPENQVMLCMMCDATFSEDKIDKVVLEGTDLSWYDGPDTGGKRIYCSGICAHRNGWKPDDTGRRISIPASKRHLDREDEAHVVLATLLCALAPLPWNHAYPAAEQEALEAAFSIVGRESAAESARRRAWKEYRSVGRVRYSAPAWPRRSSSSASQPRP
jgi:hypothetical protein